MTPLAIRGMPTMIWQRSITAWLSGVTAGVTGPLSRVYWGAPCRVAPLCPALSTSIMNDRLPVSIARLVTSPAAHAQTVMFDRKAQRANEPLF